MKLLDIPKSGKCGNVVAYRSPYGQCQRQLAVPTNRQTTAREQMRGAFGRLARAWSAVLTEAQRERWNYAGPQVMSHPRLSQRGVLSGQQHFQGINSSRACIGLPPLWEPPLPVVFGLSPVRELVIENGEGGVRLLLRVSGPAEEDVMVFGQAPCSAGRSKRRNVSYLGLLRPAVDGLSEITDLYKAKFGEPRAGTKVFIVTRQQQDGWEGPRRETSEIVPVETANQATRKGLNELDESNGLQGVGAMEQASTEGQNGSKPLMYKGCTREVQGNQEPPGSEGGEARDKVRRPKSEGGGPSDRKEAG